MRAELADIKLKTEDSGLFYAGRYFADNEDEMGKFIERFSRDFSNRYDIQDSTQIGYEIVSIGPAPFYLGKRVVNEVIFAFYLIKPGALPNAL